MELHIIRGGNKEDLDQKKYNIGIGVSLGNKWFSIENTIELIRWSLSHTKEFVVVYVADSIHAINLEVRNRISHEKALAKAIEMGTRFLDEIKQGIEKTFPDEELKKISFARWDDFMTSDFIKKRDTLHSFYESDGGFKERIHGIVKGFTDRESRQFTEQDVHKLGTYIIEELPEIICIVPIGGKIYEANAYPFDSGITQLAEEIQLGTAFPDIRKAIFDTEPKVLLEVR